MQSENIRHLVIERGVELEELISNVLAQILKINDWKNSLSLGSKGGALSFSQKMQLIKDIKGKDSIEVQKLRAFLEIRNKFAHVKDIKTFDDFFNHSEDTEKLKGKFEKWYKDRQNGKIELEQQHIQNFWFLFIDITQLLFTIAVNHVYQTTTDEVSKKFHREFLERLKAEVLKSSESNDIWNTTLEQLLIDYDQKDFLPKPL